MAMMSASRVSWGASTYTTSIVTKTYTIMEAIDNICSGELSPIEVYEQLPSELKTEIESITKQKFPRKQDFVSMVSSDQVAVIRELRSRIKEAERQAQESVPLLKAMQGAHDGSLDPLRVFRALPNEIQRVLDEMSKVISGREFCSTARAFQTAALGQLLQLIHEQAPKQETPRAVPSPAPSRTTSAPVSGAFQAGQSVKSSPSSLKSDRPSKPAETSAAVPTPSYLGGVLTAQPSHSRELLLKAMQGGNDGSLDPLRVFRVLPNEIQRVLDEMSKVISGREFCSTARAFQTAALGQLLQLIHEQAPKQETPRAVPSPAPSRTTSAPVSGTFQAGQSVKPSPSSFKSDPPSKPTNTSAALPTPNRLGGVLTAGPSHSLMHFVTVVVFVIVVIVPLLTCAIQVVVK